MSFFNELKASGALLDEDSIYGRRKRKDRGAALGARPSVNAADSVMAGCTSREVLPQMLDKAIRWKRSLSGRD